MRKAQWSMVRTIFSEKSALVQGAGRELSASSCSMEERKINEEKTLRQIQNSLVQKMLHI